MNFTFLLPAPKSESLFPIYDSPFSILCSLFPTPHMHSLLLCSYCLSASLPIISCPISPNIPYFPCSLFITPYLLPSDHPFPHSPLPHSFLSLLLSLLLLVYFLLWALLSTSCSPSTLVHPILLFYLFFGCLGLLFPFSPSSFFVSLCSCTFSLCVFFSYVPIHPFTLHFPFPFSLSTLEKTKIYSMLSQGLHFVISC